MDMLQQIKNNTQRVEEIMEKYPETRNSDKLLWLAYMVLYRELKDVIDDTTYKAFRTLLLEKDTPTFESLSRCRRKIQEKDEKLQATPEVKMQRNVNQSNISNWAKELKDNL